MVPSRSQARWNAVATRSAGITSKSHCLEPVSMVAITTSRASPKVP